MAAFPPLDTFGRRIIVCGPSNSGKSTLCVALGARLGVPAIHLDLLYHQPNTDWVPRPADEFVTLHDAAIAGENWVVEGNYFGTIPQRLQRATGIVLLGSGPWAALFRYARRTLFQRRRPGMLEGGIDRLNVKMLRFILVEQPPKRPRDRTILTAAGLPMVELHSMSELSRLYTAWDLVRQ